MLVRCLDKNSGVKTAASVERGEMIIEDGHRKLKFDVKMLIQIKQYCQTKTDDLEAGGVLAGRENISNENLIIEYMTFPASNDIRTRTKYIRRDIFHGEFFQKLYKASEGTIRYIGEWHTHPEDFPQYSYTDFQNWKKIIQQSGIDDYHYHLIAGRKEVAVWKYSDKLKAPWILARVEWDKMNYS